MTGKQLERAQFFLGRKLNKIAKEIFRCADGKGRKGKGRSRGGSGSGSGGPATPAHSTGAITPVPRRLSADARWHRKKLAMKYKRPTPRVIMASAAEQPEVGMDPDERANMALWAAQAADRGEGALHVSTGRGVGVQGTVTPRSRDAVGLGAARKRTATNRSRRRRQQGRKTPKQTSGMRK